MRRLAVGTYPRRMAGLDPRELGGGWDLAAYAGAVLLAWLVTLSLRALLRRAGRVTVDRELPPEQVAYLTGGPRQAVYAAVTALRSVGSVQASNSRILASGPLPPGSGEITAGVYQAALGGAPVVVLPAHPAVRGPLDRAGDLLRGRGALLSPGRRLAMRSATTPLIVVGVFGGVRFALNLPTGDPPPPLPTALCILTLILALASFFTGIVVAARAQIRTRGGDVLVTDLRRRHAGLARSAGSGPALAVGLFGTAVLWAADPAFARAADVPEQRVTRGGGYGGDGGYSVDDNSGCGGGGSCGTS